ncbi:hypothetical protein IMG5_043080, partial [Ichthyophthirius multifiliis]
LQSLVEDGNQILDEPDLQSGIQIIDLIQFQENSQTNIQQEIDEFDQIKNYFSNIFNKTKVVAGQALTKSKEIAQNTIAKVEIEANNIKEKLKDKNKLQEDFKQFGQKIETSSKQFAQE